MEPVRIFYILYIVRVTRGVILCCVYVLRGFGCTLYINGVVKLR